MARTAKRKGGGARFRARAVREWKASGLSQREFAAKRGLAASSLSRWAVRAEPERRRSAKERPSADASFVEVVAEPPVAVRSGPMLRLVMGGVVAEFTELPPPDYVAAVGSAMARPTC